MFQSVLAILFIVKLVKSSKFYALRFTQSHYKTEAKVRVVLKKLERLVCKIEKGKQT